MSNYDPNYIPTKNPFLLGVKLLLINNKNEILLLQRSDKVSRAHGWDFPGGAVDAAEAPEDAIIRELLEETGIQIPSAGLFTSHIIKEASVDAVILGFSAKTDLNEVRLSWEHQAYKWVPFEEVLQIELPSLYTKIVKTYKKNTSN